MFINNEVVDNWANVCFFVSLEEKIIANFRLVERLTYTALSRLLKSLFQNVFYSAVFYYYFDHFVV